MSESVDIELPENLTISNAHSFHDELESMIEKQPAKDLVLRADKVNRADTAGLQLMVAFVQSGKERQINVTWKEPSPALLDTAADLGLITSLGLH